MFKRIRTGAVNATRVYVSPLHCAPSLDAHAERLALERPMSEVHIEGNMTSKRKHNGSTEIFTSQTDAQY